MKHTEAMIQRGILDYLELFGRTNRIYYFRAGAGSMKTEHGRFFKTGRPGLPDIIVCYRGKLIGLEVKTLIGRQSQAQKAAQADIEAAGGEYHIVRSVGDVKKLFDIPII